LGTAEFRARYSPARASAFADRKITGKPDRKLISTSFVECHNLTLRMNNRRFTRLSTGYSKKLENLKHSLALYFFHYNFCRIHHTLRVTPAMEFWRYQPGMERRRNGGSKKMRIKIANASKSRLLFKRTFCSIRRTHRF